MTTTRTRPESGRLSLPVKLLLFVGVPLLLLALLAAAFFAGLMLLRGSPVDLHYRADAGTSVRVAVPNARLELVATTGSEVTVDVTGSATGPEPRFEVDTTGDETRVRGGCRPQWFSFCSLTVQVGLPAGSDLAVTGTNGDITVDGVQGTVRVETTNGRLAISSASGPVTATTTNGGIELTDATAERVVASTTNGAVRLAFTDAPLSVEAHSTNGAIGIELPDDGESYYIDARTTNGSVGGSVESDRQAERTITARTTNGGVTVDWAR